ncbi:MAG: presqualene diphosphate synthase HpnD [Vicinamibacterales bacterium]|nr:presqualene diphosphate synthase HpnD [Vicinamibacterales bacterium]
MSIAMARRNTNFYYSFVVLPEPKRRAIIAVWDFCRAVDDDVDERAGQLATEESRRAAAAALAGWRDELAACYEGRQPRTPQGLALAPHVAAFNLPRAPFEDVISGVEMDLDRPRFGTFDQLREYCLRVASAVGLVCIEIFEYTNPQCRQYAIDLGIALQLTNILRDLGGDLAGGRLYLPAEDLARFGVTEDDLRAGRATEPVRALLDFESRRARGYYLRAAEELPREDAKRLAPARIMGAIYFHLLRRIERSGFDVFGAPIRVPRWRQASIAASTWIAAMTGL